MKLFVPLMLAALGLSSMAPALHAGPVVPASSCAPDFSVCSVYEDQNTLFPGFPNGFIAASGDVVVQSNAMM
jgi:hypothetical protein